MSGVISIQGNLGAGKTTLLSLSNVSIIKEPVDEWENTNGGSILERYYKDPKRWAFTFQLNALHSRSLLWKKITTEQPNCIHFSERSPMADRHIFGEMMARQGNLYSIAQSLMSNCPIKAIIYLRCNPQVCLQRIRQRGRKGQQQISLQYLQKIHERHQDWINRIKNSMNVLTIDTGIYDIFNQQNKEHIVNMINDFVKRVNE